MTDYHIPLSSDFSSKVGDAMPVRQLKRGRVSVLALLVVPLAAAAGLLSSQMVGQLPGPDVTGLLRSRGNALDVIRWQVRVAATEFSMQRSPWGRPPWADLIGDWEGPMGTIRVGNDGSGAMTVASWSPCSEPHQAAGPCDPDEITVTLRVTSATATQVQADVVRSNSVVLGHTLKFKRSHQPRENLELDIGNPALTEGSYYFCKVDDPHAGDEECA